MAQSLNRENNKNVHKDDIGDVAGGKRGARAGQEHVQIPHLNRLDHTCNYSVSLELDQNLFIKSIIVKLSTLEVNIRNHDDRGGPLLRRRVRNGGIH